MKKKVFFLRFFLPLISSRTRKFRSFWSDNELRERSNEQWTLIISDKINTFIKFNTVFWF